MLDEQNQNPINPTEETVSPVELANPVVVPGTPTKEPDDMFGDIDSLRVEEAAATPQQSINQAQDALPVKSSGFSSILMKLLIGLVALAVLAGVALVAYPYIKSMLSSEEEIVEFDSEEIAVDNAYNFPDETYEVDNTVTDEMIEVFNAENNTVNPLPNIAGDEESDEDLMVEPEKSLSDLLSGGTNEETEIEEEIDSETDSETDSENSNETPIDLNKDTDNDGLTDEEEKKLGTHPMKADTDNDGLTDREEVMTYKTNPLEFDTDGDGLSDYDEIMIYKSNPLLADTDGDGYTDGVEVSGGYNPNGPGQLEN